LGQFKTFGEHLVDLTAPDGALSHSLTGIEQISDQLTKNDNIRVSLQNFRESSEKLKSMINNIGPAGENIKEFTETVKAQPWRLIWPSTKKYPAASPTPAPGEATITVRKSTKTRSTPTPRNRPR
ncbi:MAG TPA: hypothetical protein DCO65_02775, partial [Spartobacteria bacterium]|nr:hypothetical protein [Spartobacteria bacterium]